MESTAAYFRRTILPRPFATGAGAPLTVIGQDNIDPLNFQDGFKSVYEHPIDDNGRFVTRGDMNAIGNLASQSQFYFQAGGVNSFDQDFAHAIGGYPEGAVLDYLIGTRLYKVVSLHDNNLVDFTGATSRYKDGAVKIDEGSVDNVNWAYANMDAPIDTRTVAFSLPAYIPSGTTANVLTKFTALKNGLLITDGTCTINPYESGYGESTTWIGAGLFVIREDEIGENNPVPFNPGNLVGWTPFSAIYNWGYMQGSSFSSCTARAYKVQAGVDYVVAVSCGYVKDGLPCVTDLNMKVYIV